jgi:tetratricopeptide (TPR) repeat protein
MAPYIYDNLSFVKALPNAELKQLYDQALEAGRRRDYPQAVRLLQELLVTTDQFPEALLLLGRSYHALGDFARAAQVLQLYINANPGSAPGHFFAGRSYLALGLPELAVRYLKRSVELDPGYAPAMGLLALAVLKSGKPAVAVGLFEQALALDPDNPRLANGYQNARLTLAIRLYRRRRYAEAEALFEALEAERPDSLVVHLHLAGIHRERGDLARSIKHWDEAVRLAPEDPILRLQKAAVHLQRGETTDALLELGEGFRRLGASAPAVSDPLELARLAMMVLFRSRRYRQALEYARMLLRASYRDTQAHAIMAECFAALHEPAKAANHYRRALDVEPGKLELFYGLAGALWEAGRYPELSRLAARIAALSPDDGYAAYYLALCRPLLGERFEATIPALQEQIRRHGPDPTLMCTLGREYLRADLPELARGWLERTLKADAGNEPALLARIEAERRLADADRSLAACAQYLERYPQNSQVRREYAELLFDRREYARAASQIEQLLPRQPRHRGLRRMLARSYRGSRRNAEAVLLFRDLLRENPSSEELLRELALALAASGSQPSAVALVRKATQAFPGRPGLHVLLGGLYAKAHDLERAAQTLRQAMAAFPGDWRLARSLGLLYRRQGNSAFAERFLARARELKKNGGRRPPGPRPPSG